MRRYPTYKRDWTPTGETSNVPQYPGQMPIGGRLPRVYTVWGLAWRIALAIIIIYVMLTAALVLTGA